jgi:hypothetical protein
MADSERTPHTCRCLTCQQVPQGAIAQDHQAINRVLASLNEKGRRLFAGLLAGQRGHGGVVEVAIITGLSRTTIHRGILDLQAPAADSQRVRQPGGGRKRVEKKFPA